MGRKWSVADAELLEPDTVGEHIEKPHPAAEHLFAGLEGAVLVEPDRPDLSVGDGVIKPVVMRGQSEDAPFTGCRPPQPLVMS